MPWLGTRPVHQLQRRLGLQGGAAGRRRLLDSVAGGLFPEHVADLASAAMKGDREAADRQDGIFSHDGAEAGSTPGTAAVAGRGAASSARRCAAALDPQGPQSGRIGMAACGASQTSARLGGPGENGRIVLRIVHVGAPTPEHSTHAKLRSHLLRMRLSATAYVWQSDHCYLGG
ncbi:hypothetical protein D3C72_790130 [compost metagenome]